MDAYNKADSDNVATLVTEVIGETEHYVASCFIPGAGLRAARSGGLANIVCCDGTFCVAPVPSGRAQLAFDGSQVRVLGV